MTTAIHEPPTREELAEALHTLDMLIVAMQDDTLPFSTTRGERVQIEDAFQTIATIRERF